MLDSPALPVASRWPSARRLFLFRCVEVGWMVAYPVLLLALSAFGMRSASTAGFYDTLSNTVEVLWLAFGAVQVGFLAGLRRDVGAHPAAGLLRAAFALAAVDLAGWAALTVAGILAPGALYGSGSLGTVASGVLMLVSLAFDVAFWMTLERLLGRVAAALRGAFFGLRLLSLSVAAFSLLSHDAFRALLLTGSFATFFPWVRLAVSVSWNAVAIVALHRVSQSAPLGATVDADAAAPDGTGDLVMGVIWLAGGLLVTLASYSTAAGGGRYVVTTGAIAYGCVRIVRGLSRRGRR